MIGPGGFMAAPKNESQSDPYAEGMDAAHKGQSAATCPYEYNTREGQDWLIGFEDGGGDD